MTSPDRQGSAVGPLERFRRLLAHDHDHPGRPLADSGAAGIRATKISLVGLAATAALQAVIVAFTGSVALLSDTIHNLTDALTAIPLWIAFAIGRRPATRRFTYGFHRAEDLAGLLILAVIAISAGAVAWESIRRFFEPRGLSYAGWVIAAGLVGALGNDLVARYRIRTGKRIGSEALVTDGYHARTDALTSLSVVGAGIGAALGWQWADPLAGLAVAVIIMLLLRRSAIRMFGRLLDAVDPQLVERARTAANGVDGVQAVEGVALRWQGHRLAATLSVAVDPDISVRDGHEIAQQVRHALMHTFPFSVDALIHVDPHGEEESHALTVHHERHPPGPDAPTGVDGEER